MSSPLFVGPDQKTRCPWVAGAPEFLAYHDQEWGFPVADNRRLFEKLCLESFQSGLSWRTILNKREAFRQAFEQFDAHRMAAFGEADVARLLQDSGIVRHRGKIEAVLHNARRMVALEESGSSLAELVWSLEPRPEERPAELTWEVLRKISESPASRAIASTLKKQGWKFFGPTTAYAFMQAMGLVNDHVEGCICREPVEQARAAFVRPGR